MYLRHITGKNGEEIAKEYLENKGYTVLCKNFRCKQGELDIICKEKNVVIFVEVKTRKNKKYGEPIEAVTKAKREHMIKAIEYYLYINKLENSYIRIDVVEILFNDEKYTIRHIKNAFEKRA